MTIDEKHNVVKNIHKDINSISKQTTNNEIILENGILLPNICYGSPIININTQNKMTMIKSYIGKILKLNFKEIDKANKLSKIIRRMKNVNEKSLIDTSRAYGASEFFIGKSIKNNRDKYFIVTKVSNSQQYSGNIKKGLEKSLEQLHTDFVDCLLMHWPVKDLYLDTWKQMEECYELGLCKSIGVCNCNIHHLEEIKSIAKIKPMINQFECHPLFTQNELREYCKKENIKIMAYTATARMDERLKKTCILDIANKYHKTMAQVILRWHIQIGNIPIFSTTNWKHYIENMNIFDFDLTKDEIDNITAININSRLRYDPDNCDFKKL